MEMGIIEEEGGEEEEEEKEEEEEGKTKILPRDTEGQGHTQMPPNLKMMRSWKSKQNLRLSKP
ncbi:Hypothetical predicted protein [Lynx pardinus]|uniref:Uncharacterized protein n=1 Tax=Lynx pardinus TaxID=191816 RepID=A0A485N8E2_LYNPA|nr:Hypothetical predicted protein [Lynx pardinus]